MTKAFIFWLLMILWLLFGVAGTWPNAAADGSRWKYVGPAGGILLFVLLALLGWGVFGSPVK